jgi:hypothetical protein
MPVKVPDDLIAFDFMQWSGFNVNFSISISVAKSLPSRKCPNYKMRQKDLNKKTQTKKTLSQRAIKNTLKNDASLATDCRNQRWLNSSTIWYVCFRITLTACACNAITSGSDRKHVDIYCATD